MRTILFTGPGGSGRTTVAAATALAAARGGARTLLLGTDRSDTLGAVLGTPTGPEPVRLAPGLTAWRPDATARFRDDLAAFQERAATVLDLLGAGRLDPEELTPLPGAEELAVLRALRDAALAEDAHDLVVVDLPPTESALALLALPAELRRYLRRLLPPERQAARALRPVLGRLAGVPLPAEWLYDTAARWDRELAAAEAVVTDPGTTVRIVAEPSPAGADAVRTAALGLALRALAPEALIANRILPQDTEDPWLAGPVAQQRKILEQWRETYGGVLHAVPHLGGDPRGADDLAALPVPGRTPRPAPVEWPVTDHLADDGVLVWHIPLPGTTRHDLDLIRRGDELVLGAGRFRRIVSLPSALRRCTVAGASLREGELRIRFAPDPGLWPGAR
ncbi:ArsA family ATPase [Streptomyces sp. NPDC059477]|uniref:ArsA family ATPase n=1 Tax=Streptomyces sp. NPDC059477 TaxID=3346847 RepID=UPI0036A5D00B